MWKHVQIISPSLPCNNNSRRLDLWRISTLLCLSSSFSLLLSFILWRRHGWKVTLQCTEINVRWPNQSRGCARDVPQDVDSLTCEDVIRCLIIKGRVMSSGVEFTVTVLCVCVCSWYILRTNMLILQAMWGPFLEVGTFIFAWCSQLHRTVWGLKCGWKVEVRVGFRFESGVKWGG